jgi:TPR repeat protein
VTHGIRVTLATGAVSLALTGLFACTQAPPAGQSAADIAAVGAYRQAADRGNAKAQTQLGEAYYRGRGVPQDYAQALVWYRKAADQGDVAAQRHIGSAYDNGQGVARDYTQALAWYRKAAAAGNATAQANIVALNARTQP